MGLSPQQHSAGLFVSARYRVLRKLGSGSLGTVYLAHDTASDCRVALKVLRAERLGPEVLEQMQSEFQAIASLRHPQIAAAFDFGYTEEARVPFYTREYIEGTPLAPGPPGLEGQSSPRTFLSPFFDLLDPLHYLHAHEILHLDIHAGNVIVAKDPKSGSVWIDFAWATKTSGTRSYAVTPSRCFLPPDMVRKEPDGAATHVRSCAT